MKYYVKAEVWGFVEASNEEDAVDIFTENIDFDSLQGDFDILEIEIEKNA